jgi:hypothetical protein
MSLLSAGSISLDSTFKSLYLCFRKNIVFPDAFHIFSNVFMSFRRWYTSFKDERQKKNSRMLFLEMTWLIFIAALKILIFFNAVILKLFS